MPINNILLSSEDTISIKEKDKKYVVHPWSTINRDFDLIFSSGSNYMVNDIYGNSYIDASSLNLTCGYQNQDIIADITKQLNKFPGTDISLASHDLLGILAETLSSLFPEEITRTLFTNSGSEGIEAAIFIASAYWQNVNKPRQRILSFAQGYHGSTYLSRGLTKLPRIAHPLHGDIKIDTVEMPSSYHDLDEQNFLDNLIRSFERAINNNSDSQDLPIAVIVEPFLNIGGAIKLPNGFLKKLKLLCIKYNTLMILDEVFTGYGRTGKMFAFEHDQIVPDIVVSSKGLAGGYAPIAVVNFTEAIYQSFSKDTVIGGIRYGHTTSGHALACAAALSTIKVIQKDKLIQNAESKGHILLSAFKNYKGTDLIVDVRGFGLIVVLEIKGQNSATKFKELCKLSGVLVRQNGSAIMITPPLSIDDTGINQIVGKITNILDNKSYIVLK